jgi:hypothetical protein
MGFVSIRSLIGDELRMFKELNSGDPEVIYLDAYLLTLLAEEIGYTEEEVLFERVLEKYAGCELKVLEDESAVIRIV